MDRSHRETGLPRASLHGGKAGPFKAAITRHAHTRAASVPLAPLAADPGAFCDAAVALVPGDRHRRSGLIARVLADVAGTDATYPAEPRRRSAVREHQVVRHLAQGGDAPADDGAAWGSDACRGGAADHAARKAADPRPGATVPDRPTVTARG